MLSRRRFLQFCALAARDRPVLAADPFRSGAVDAAIKAVSADIADRLAKLFANCLPNTLQTTLRQTTVEGKPDTFVITGDIDAMWLRDLVLGVAVSAVC